MSLIEKVITRHIGALEPGDSKWKTIASKGYNEDQLMAWFDWSTIRVAHEYVSRGKKMVEDLSTRT